MNVEFAKKKKMFFKYLARCSLSYLYKRDTNLNYTEISFSIINLAKIKTDSINVSLNKCSFTPCQRKY